MTAHLIGGRQAPSSPRARSKVRSSTPAPKWAMSCGPRPTSTSRASRSQASRPLPLYETKRRVGSRSSAPAATTQPSRRRWYRSTNGTAVIATATATEDGPTGAIGRRAAEPDPTVPVAHDANGPTAPTAPTVPLPSGRSSRRARPVRGRSGWSRSECTATRFLPIFHTRNDRSPNSSFAAACPRCEPRSLSRTRRAPRARRRSTPIR